MKDLRGPDVNVKVKEVSVSTFDERVAMARFDITPEIEGHDARIVELEAEVQNQKDGYSQAMQEIGQKQLRIQSLEAALREIAEPPFPAFRCENQCRTMARAAITPQEPTAHDIGNCVRDTCEGDHTAGPPAQEPCAECDDKKQVVAYAGDAWHVAIYKPCPSCTGGD